MPQLYGVGYPVMDRAVGGRYALWFLLVLAAGKMLACSVTLGIGGSGGVFAPSLFVGATSGMAFGDLVSHLFGASAGPPALYAVVAMGAVFAAAVRAPLTSVASVIELTGDFTLTLPVMLAVAVATATSRALSYGTLYTTKLLRRGHDIDRTAPWRVFSDLKAADVMRPFPAPLPVPEPSPDDPTGDPPGHLSGDPSGELDEAPVLASESLTGTLRQLATRGRRDGLPVVSDDGRQLEGWVADATILRAIADRMHSVGGDG